MKKVMAQKTTGVRDTLKTWARRSQVAPEFVGHKIGIHNGRKHVEILISEGMVGHRLGEFSLTRTFKGHGKITKKTMDKT